MKSNPPAQTSDFFPQGSVAYREAFEILRAGMVSDVPLGDVYQRLVAGLPHRRVAVDWGAGTGAYTQHLVGDFERVYAVEPFAEMRDTLADRVPRAIAVDATMQEAEIPEPVDFGLVSHVLYHVPDTEWGKAILQAAHALGPDGVLCVALKHPEADCNRMIETFGGRRFDLFRLIEDFRHQEEFSIEFLTLPSRLETTSLRDTLAVARFMLSDRPRSSYRELPDDAALEAWVKKRFWDDSRGRGGWNLPEVLALVRPNWLRGPA